MDSVPHLPVWPVKLLWKFLEEIQILQIHVLKQMKFFEVSEDESQVSCVYNSLKLA